MLRDFQSMERVAEAGSPGGWASPHVSARGYKEPFPYALGVRSRSSLRLRFLYFLSGYRAEAYRG